MRALLQQFWQLYLHIFPVELRWLCRRLRPLISWQVVSVICLIAGSGLTLLNPLILKWLIDDILPRRDVLDLLHAVSLSFLGYAGRTLFVTFSTYLTLYVSQTMATELRMAVLHHLDTLSADFHEATPTGVKLHTMREPIDEIAYFASDLFPSLFRAFALFVLALYAMTKLNTRLTLFVLPLVPAFVIARHYFRLRLESDATAFQVRRTAFTAFLEEHFSSVLQVQLLGQEERREKVAAYFLTGAVKAQLQLARTGSFLTLAATVSIAIAVSMALGYGGLRVLAGAMSIGSLVAFSTYLTLLFDPLALAAEMYTRAQRTFSSVRQVRGTLELCPSVAESSDALLGCLETTLTLTFHHLRFTHSRGENLLDIEFLSIPPGQLLAIVGGNGAGKSTLVKLAARIYDPSEGSITYGGVDLRRLRIDYMRSAIFYIPQHPVLFDDTVAGNLRLADPSVSKSEIDAALAAVGLDGLVSGFASGANERLGPGAWSLSGGERQRLAIARGLLKRPNVLILDEATSCLDLAGEALVLDAISWTLPRTTLIFISHRFENLSRFQRILSIRDGQIQEEGTHSDLLTRNGLYCSLISAASAPATVRL